MAVIRRSINKKNPFQFSAPHQQTNKQNDDDFVLQTTHKMYVVLIVHILYTFFPLAVILSCKMFCKE